MRRWVVLLLLVMGWAGGVGRAEAQVFTPTFLAPAPNSDVGIYLSDGPGSFAVEGIWRRSFAGYDLGFRFGAADTDGASGLIGGELRSPLRVAAPLTLALTGAGQAAFGGRSGVGFLLGLSLGHTINATGLALTPYLHPRFGPVQPLRADDFSLEVLADVGLDLRLGSQLDLRLGIALGDPGASWGVGFAWR